MRKKEIISIDTTHTVLQYSSDSSRVQTSLYNAWQLISLQLKLTKLISQDTLVVYEAHVLFLHYHFTTQHCTIHYTKPCVT